MMKTYNFNEIGDYGVIYYLKSPSGKYYIGQSWNVIKRFSKYKGLDKTLKRQPKLYNALKKYGSKLFEYKIIDLCENQTELDNKEIFYIEIYDSFNNGYNSNEGGQSPGKMSEETKRKISISNTGRKPTPETIEKLRVSHLGHKITKEHIEKLRKINKGKPLSKEHREKISNSNKGKIVSEKRKELLRAKNIKFSYKILSPDNTLYETNSLSQFCVEHNLNKGHMWTPRNGWLGIYKNWRVVEKKLL